MALRLALGTTVVAAGAAMLWALAAGPAVARPGHLQLRLVRGGLTLAGPTRLLSVSRNATVTVRDARGTGGGWSLKLAAAQRVRVTRVVASCAPGSTCTLPRATVVGSGNVVLRAARNSGMGVIRLAVAFGAPATAVQFSVSP